MMERKITDEIIKSYGEHLYMEEKAAGTMQKYMRDISAYRFWLAGREVTKEHTALWKNSLLESGYTPKTVNTMLSAVNGLFAYLGWDDCRAKFVKIQRQMFRDSSRDLDVEEYRCLVDAAYGRGNDRLGMVLETICATGIRVSELEYITVEAAKKGKVEVSLKGKIRVILLPRQLCRKLAEYAAGRKIKSGEIFLTKNGNRLSRQQIWLEMKRLCDGAGVEPSKAFPHNLRHLFAKTYYRESHDIVSLADVLGHSSIDTTRIYLLTTGAEHLRRMDSLGLVS